MYYFPNKSVEIPPKNPVNVTSLGNLLPKDERQPFDHTCEAVHTHNGEICDKYCVTFYTVVN